jgi:hypothetical protein
MHEAAHHSFAVQGLSRPDDQPWVGDTENLARAGHRQAQHLAREVG